ncbi:hypothetical protein B9Z55_004435 [Caenorhabditis nigoni]|uniref:Domain of unknown function WSN domain-containing protein n=1 Tax=Caenorhabditis nigoni TaxID=1611254 RepID=A0A2G5UWJ6_9PELO|nr:hypothetical protein B9Z55_004435 [Caenorhabditis nigoni]
MWLIKLFPCLLLIGLAKSEKDSQFALEEYYQEASEIYEKANKIHLEYELATGKIGSLEVAERILNKKMDASVLEEYVEMKISGGLKEQNQMLELFEKAKESETSDQLRDDVENGFTLMDGFSDLRTELSEFTLDFENDFERMELSAYYDFSRTAFTSKFKDIYGFFFDIITEVVEPLSHIPEDQELSYDEKEIISKNMWQLESFHTFSHVLLRNLEELGFKNDMQGLESFKQMQVVTEKLNSMMEEVKSLEGLASEIPKIEKEMEILEELRDGNEVEEIKNRIQNLTKSADFLKNFRTAKNFHGEYQGIQSIAPLLQKIKSFLSKMKTFEFRKSKTFEAWSQVNINFETANIPSNSLTEKFSIFKECIQNFDFHLRFSMEILTDLDEKLTRVFSLDLENQDIVKRIKKLEDKTINFPSLIETKYSEPSKVDRELLALIQDFVNENAWLHDHNPKDFKTHPTYPDRKISTLEYNLLDIRDLIREIDLDSVRKVLTNVNTPKTFLECYSNLGVTASEIKELLVLPGKIWNFNPKVLEGTVEVVGMFKEAYQMIEDIKEWKVASNPEIENFPLDGEDVKTVSDGINVLETLRNVANGWGIMKTLNVEDSGIKDSWDFLDSSLSQFFEILSSQKILNLSNVSFPTDLPIDTIRTFIEDVYQENQRNDILNFLKEIQKLETDFPEYPEKLEKMNEAMGKIKEWDNGKMNPVKEMVDCFEMECNATLELPEASN